MAVARAPRKNQRKPRVVVPRPRIKGKGFFKIGGLAKSLLGGIKQVGALIPKGALQAAGTAIGGKYGGAHGSALGGAAGGLISKITGVGDYEVKSNSILLDGTVPTFVARGDGVTICHREFIQDIVTGTGSPSPFTLTALPINPGLASFAPWLSQIAQYFEQYEMVGLVYEYRPSSGMVTSTSPALGVVCYATNYDPLDPNFATKQQMDSYEFSSSCIPYNNMMHPVECAPNQTANRIKYIRPGAVPSGGDIRLYDVGKFQFATVGMPASTPYTVGELWVSYHIRLLKPRISTVLTSGGATFVGGMSANETNPLSGITFSEGNPLIGYRSSVQPSNGFVFPFAGVYRCGFRYISSVDITTEPTLTGSDGLTFPIYRCSSVGTGCKKVAFEFTVVVPQSLAPGNTNTNTVALGGAAGYLNGTTEALIALSPS